MLNKHMCLKIRHVRTSMDAKVESCVQDFYVHSTIRIPMLGEVLICESKLDNTEDIPGINVCL